MTIKFRCKCGKKLKVDDKFPGTKGRCPHCGGVVEIPRVEISNAGVNREKNVEEAISDRRAASANRSQRRAGNGNGGGLRAVGETGKAPAAELSDLPSFDEIGGRFDLPDLGSDQSHNQTNGTRVSELPGSTSRNAHGPSSPIIDRAWFPVAVVALCVVGTACIIGLLLAVRSPGATERVKGDRAARTVAAPQPQIKVRPMLLALSAPDLLKKAEKAEANATMKLEAARAFFARQEYTTGARLLTSPPELTGSKRRKAGRLCYHQAHSILTRWNRPNGGSWASMSGYGPWLLGILAARELVLTAEKLGVRPANEEEEIVRLLACYSNNNTELDRGSQDFLERHPRSVWAPAVLFWRAWKLNWDSKTKAQAAEIFNHIVNECPGSPMADLALMKQGALKRLMDERPNSPYASAAFYRLHGLEQENQYGWPTGKTGERLIALQTIVEKYPESVVAWHAEQQLFGLLFDICGSKWVKASRADLESFVEDRPNAIAARIARNILQVSDGREAPAGVERLTERKLKQIYRPGTIGYTQIKEWLRSGQWPAEVKAMAERGDQMMRSRGFTSWPVMPERTREILSAVKAPLWAPAHLAELPEFSRPAVEGACDLSSIWTPLHRVDSDRQPSGRPYFALMKEEGAVFVRSPLQTDRPPQLVFRGAVSDDRPEGYCRHQKTGMYPTFTGSISFSIKADYVQPVALGDAIYVDMILRHGIGYSQQGVYRSVAAINRDTPWTRIRKTLDFCPPPLSRSEYQLFVSVSAPNCFGRVLIDDLVVVYGTEPAEMSETLSGKEIEQRILGSAGAVRPFQP